MPGFTEYGKDLDFILSVRGMHGRAFEQGETREKHEESTAKV